MMTRFFLEAVGGLLEGVAADTFEDAVNNPAPAPAVSMGNPKPAPALRRKVRRPIAEWSVFDEFVITASKLLSQAGFPRG